ncbi:MAG TPA: fused MFS/spermidine synthase [Gammaproteobacteria bacterium]|nr:fused MFS/spermidine synthase [Gammaproteobacteria bacterium]
MKMRLLTSIALLLAAPALVHAQVLYKKKSLYRNIVVTDSGDLRCLKFSVHRHVPLEQSCVYDSNRDDMVFAYTKFAMSGVILDAHPKRILIAGLGGAVLPYALHELYPRARIDTVEIDRAVVDVARRFFDYKPAGTQHVIVSDARVYIKHAIARSERYDMIILDAFNGDYIPPHLMTVEFLRECRQLLAPDGVLVANTFSSSKLYDSESVTYRKAFGWFLNVTGMSGNRIILTRKGEPVSPAELARRAKAYPYDLSRFGIDVQHLANLASDKRNWDPHAPVLTDQYAPVNLLNGPRRALPAKH